MLKTALLKTEKQMTFLDNAHVVYRRKRKVCRCESAVGLAGGFASQEGKMGEASLLWGLHIMWPPKCFMGSQGKPYLLAREAAVSGCPCKASPGRTCLPGQPPRAFCL